MSEAEADSAPEGAPTAPGSALPDPVAETKPKKRRKKAKKQAKPKAAPSDEPSSEPAPASAGRPEPSAAPADEPPAGAGTDAPQRPQEEILERARARSGRAGVEDADETKAGGPDRARPPSLADIYESDDENIYEDDDDDDAARDAMPTLEDDSSEDDDAPARGRARGGADDDDDEAALSRFEFVNNVIGTNIPSEYIPSCEKGARAACKKGNLIGAPLQGVRVVLEDGQSHAVDSSDLAFSLAMQGAVRDAVTRARPVVLEPVMAAEVIAPVDEPA